MKSIRLFACLALAVSVLCAGCAAGAAALGPVVSGALGVFGIGKPDSEKPPREVALSIAAAPNLNAGKNQKPVSLVVKLYVLKDRTTFSQAPFDAFVSEESEKRVLGSDLLAAREITLLPGKSFTSTEKIPREAQAFGIVALFRAPGAQRWRVAFDPARSQKAGMAVEMQACAIAVSKGVVAGDAPPASAARCG
jgi:type VI secretion system protein VasD